MKTLNGSPGFGNSMDENEIKYFLDNQQISIQLGVIEDKMILMYILLVSISVIFFDSFVDLC